MKTAKYQYTLIEQSEILIEQSPLIEQLCMPHLYNFSGYVFMSYLHKVQIFTTSIVIIVYAALFLKFDCGYVKYKQ